MKGTHLSKVTSVLLGLSLCSAQAVEINWVKGADGGWEEAANWLTKDAVPVSRVPGNDDSIRPRAAYVITYSASSGVNILGSATLWQDTGTSHASHLQTGGELELYQVYLTGLKTNPDVDYEMTGGSLYVRRNLNMTWNNSSSVDSRFLQTGGSVRFGTSGNQGMWMCIKSSTQKAYYDLEGGEFEASEVHMTQGGVNATAVFTQSNGTTAVVNRFIELGKTAGTDGEASYRLNGGSLTIQQTGGVAAPFVFYQPGAPVYVDINGGTLNLKGTWDFPALSGIANSDFRSMGEPATEHNLEFTPVTIDLEAYTAITSRVATEGTVLLIR